MKRSMRLFGVVLALGATSAFAQRPPAPAPPPASVDGKWMKQARAGKDLYATLTTTQGEVVLRLLSKEAPETVTNFVGLATGEREWTDPKTGQRMKKKPLYDGTIFHRVIDGFMIQGGDPTGTGMGGPGYEFKNEPPVKHVFDRPGIAAMANHGKDTNGSQFFITVAPQRHLTGGYTIFAEVVKGMDAVYAIAKAQTSRGDRPVTDQVLKKVAISDKAPAGLEAKPEAPAKKLSGDAPVKK